MLKEKIMKKKTIVFVFCCLVWVSTVSSQPDDSALFDAVEDTPVNGGIYFLLVAGLIYGIFHANKIKKKEI
jgi:hypothetical protein